MTGTLATGDSGDAGLYRAETAGGGGNAVGGWILSASGEERGGMAAAAGAGEAVGQSVLTLSRPGGTLQGPATAQIAKVGISPLPIP